jgi:hypothetical protein
MTAPVPSTVRTIRLYAGGAGPNAGLVSPDGPNLMPRWPAKHPLDNDFYWVNATGLCHDLQDTIAQAGVSIVLGDSSLQVPMVAISTDGLQAGFMLEQGTPGLIYIVRAHLTFTQGTSYAEDIRLQVRAHGPIPPPIPAFVTNNGDILTLGGLPFPSGV